jgi:hypothetical protein
MQVSIKTKCNVILNLCDTKEGYIVKFDIFGRESKWVFEQKIKAFRKFIELKNLMNS